MSFPVESSDILVKDLECLNDSFISESCYYLPASEKYIHDSQSYPYLFYPEHEFVNDNDNGKVISDVEELGVDLSAQNIDFDYLNALELATKISAVGTFTYLAGSSMIGLYAAGLATTALATAVHQYYDSPKGDNIADAILKIELGVLKNFGMRVLYSSVQKGMLDLKNGEIVESSLEWTPYLMHKAFGPKLPEYIKTSGGIKYFVIPIALNLTVTFMAEAFGYIQNKLFLEESTEGRLKLETDPFFTYRGPHTVFKRAIKNTFGRMIPDILELDRSYNKYLSLFGHFAANFPIALYYNQDAKIETTAKTSFTSFAKVAGEFIMDKIVSSYTGIAEKKLSIWQKLISTIVGTTTYVVSKKATKTPKAD